MEDNQPQPSSGPGYYSWQYESHAFSEKSSNWNLLMMMTTVAVATTITLVSYLITKSIDILPALVIVIFGIFVMVSSRVRPAEHTYTLDATGLSIDSRRYDFEKYRGFIATEKDGAVDFEMVPIARFALPIHFACSAEQLDQVVAALEPHLPLVDERKGLMESIVKRIGI